MAAAGITVHGTIETDLIDCIRREVGGHRNLTDVLPLGKPKDVVTQDEYTHDVIMHFESAYVVYDVT